MRLAQGTVEWMSSQDNESDSRQRTVAELLAQYGGDSGGSDAPSGRRRRADDAAEDTAPQAIINRVLSDSRAGMTPVSENGAPPTTRAQRRAAEESAQDGGQPAAVQRPQQGVAPVPNQQVTPSMGQQPAAPPRGPAGQPPGQQQPVQQQPPQQPHGQQGQLPQAPMPPRGPQPKQPTRVVSPVRPGAVPPPNGQLPPNQQGPNGQLPPNQQAPGQPVPGQQHTGPQQVPQQQRQPLQQEQTQQVPAVSSRLQQTLNGHAPVQRPVPARGPGADGEQHTEQFHAVGERSQHDEDYFDDDYADEHYADDDYAEGDHHGEEHFDDEDYAAEEHHADADEQAKGKKKRFGRRKSAKAVASDAAPSSAVDTLDRDDRVGDDGPRRRDLDEHDRDDDRDDDHDDDHDDEAAHESGAKEWATVLGLVVAGVVGGAAVWLGFDWLWGWKPIVAIIAAVIAVGAMVFAVRKIRHTSDVQTTVFAVIVGLVVTVSPATLLIFNN